MGGEGGTGGIGGKRRWFRVRKQVSAYFYCILESHEGVASYSTLPHRAGDPHRDLLLFVPDGMAEAADRVLAELRRELGDAVVELEDGPLYSPGASVP